jgi:hypothetical protein
MKKISIITILIFASALTSLLCFLACENKVTPPKNRVNFYLNGTTKIEIANFKETDNTVKVVIDTTTCYVFENEKDLLMWTDKPESNANIIQFKNLIKSGTHKITSFQDEANRKGILNDEEQMQQLFNSFFIDSLQQPLATRGAGVLFTGYNSQGAALPIPGKLPKLTGSWNNSISSIGIAATTVLCDGWWFGGQKVWILLDSRNLSDYGFDNRTSSVF